MERLFFFTPHENISPWLATLKHLLEPAPSWELNYQSTQSYSQSTHFFYLYTFLFFVPLRSQLEKQGENQRKQKKTMILFFLVFVLFTSRWSVRKVLDCFFNMHLCAKLQPYSSKKSAVFTTVQSNKLMQYSQSMVLPRPNGLRTD